MSNTPAPVHAPSESEEQESILDLEKHLKWLTPVLAGILVLTAVYLWRQGQGTDLRAEVALAYATASSPEELEAIADVWPAQPEAPLALLQAASLRFNDREFAAAKVLYENFLTAYPTHPMRENAEWGVWMSAEGTGDLDTALTGFVSVTENQLLYPQALLAQARVQEQKDNPEAALALYTQVQESFPETPWSEQARVYTEQVELGRR